MKNYRLVYQQHVDRTVDIPADAVSEFIVHEGFLRIQSMDGETLLMVPGDDVVGLYLLNAETPATTTADAGQAESVQA